MSFPKMIHVESSSIDSVGYDSDAHLLYVRFRENGKLYAYEEVEETVFVDLMRARSKGTFVNRWIKDRYPYTELGA